MKKPESLLHLAYYITSMFLLKIKAEKNAKRQRKRPFKSTVLQLLNQFIRLLTLRVRPALEEEIPPSPLSLPSLPTEIVLLIFDQLSLPTQACLALTCKVLYEDLGYILQDERLALPTLRANKTAEPPLSQLTLLRNQFLSKIKDDRWLYCSGCLKIHPSHLFFRNQLSRPFGRRKCKHLTGVLDVCPCLVLTYHDKLLLEQWLQTKSPNKEMSKRVRLAFTPPTTDDSKPTLVHRCSITDHAQATIDITVTALIGDSDSLELHSSHHVHFNFARAAIDEISRPYRYNGPTGQLEPIFLCPHLDILKVIFCCRPLEPRTCDLCATTAQTPDWIDEEMNVMVQGVRHPGKVPMAWDWMCRRECDGILRRWYNSPKNQAFLT